MLRGRRFVLCQINVSSAYPFPKDALAPLVAVTLALSKANVDFAFASLR